MTRVEQTIDRIRRLGWAPVRWSHHPPAIKALIREARFSPRAKDCYSNCGKVILASIGTEHEAELTYVEGVLKRPPVAVSHCWLHYRGQLVDLTVVDDDVASEYELCQTALPVEVAAMALQKGRFGPYFDVISEAAAQALFAMNRAVMDGRL